MESCLWCGKEELKYKPPNKHTEYVCSTCTLKLAGCTQETLKELREECEKAGNDRRLDALKSFIGEEEYVPKTRKARSGMVGKGPVRSARLARNQVRS